MFQFLIGEVQLTGFFCLMAAGGVFQFLIGEVQQQHLCRLQGVL